MEQKALVMGENSKISPLIYFFCIRTILTKDIPSYEVVSVRRAFFLHVKTIVGFVTIQAKLFIAIQTDPVRAGGFSAAIAGVRRKQPGFFRKPYGGFLYIKHLFRLASLVIGKGFLFGHTRRLGFHYQADRLARLPVEERIGRLTPHPEQQITLAHAASQHHLNTINAAGDCNAPTNSCHKSSDYPCRTE